VLPPGSTTKTRKRPRLLCEPAAPSRRTGAAASAQPAVAHPRRTRRRRPAHYTVYCRGI
jgi:hypothetical protein